MRRSGFTLIELLIVVAIIAILAAIAVPNFLEAQTRAKVSRAKADMRSLATAIESYRVDGNSYPIAGQWVSWSTDRPMPDNFNNRMLGLTTPISYITSLPQDPFANKESVFPFDENPTYEYEDIKTAVATVGFGASMLSYNLFQNENAYSLYFGGNEGSPVQWNLLSAGPDRRNDFQQTSGVINEAGALLAGINNLYDPTNGTVSRGDVYRTNVSQRE